MSKVMELHLSDVEAKELAEKAKNANMPFNAWVRVTLGLAMPDNPEQIVQITTPGPLSGAALDAADEAIAVEDKLFGYMQPPSAPLAADSHAAESSSQRISGNIPMPEVAAGHAPISAHGCKHLVREYGNTFGPNQCQGTCYSPRQKGRVCMWPAAQASNCGAYVPMRQGHGHG